MEPCEEVQQDQERATMYRTLHTLLIGGQRVVSTRSAIVPNCNPSGMRGTAITSIDKCVNLHIEQHNQHADL